MGSPVTEAGARGYIYAILHSPEYRRRYREPLQLDFPRIPITGVRILFDEMSRFGSELIGLHLLESEQSLEKRPAFSGDSLPEVEKVAFDGNSVWIDKKQTCGFKGVSDEVWSFRIDRCNQGELQWVRLEETVQVPL